MSCLSIKSLSVAFLFGGLALHSAFGQARPQIVDSVDVNRRVALAGNVQPLIHRAIDQGIADQSGAAGRMMLVLKRSAESEASLKQYLVQAHTAGSPTYHKWITPTEFGERFGAATSDIEQVKAWMESQGLTVTRTLPGRMGIEFTGTTGQVGAAFHTSIHTFSVNGETHHANISDPQIPAALANVVRGVSSLNDFRLHPESRSLGKVSFNVRTHDAKALWTTSSGGNPLYLLSPGDFATQYDVASTYSSGTTGKGQIIGIINDSNIDTSVADAYRSLFSLPANTPQVIVDGTDPGQTADVIEAYLDVENAGAAAPDATVRLYVAGTFGLNGYGGILFSLARAIEDNEASVLNISFGACEQSAGDSTNGFVNLLMEEAAAQGQTVLVSSGDSGSAGCDLSFQSQAENGLAVNGLASTPWNIAVGGTDLYYSDFASGGSTIANYWNPTNTNYTSLQKQVPEQVWNDGVFGNDIALYDPPSIQTYTIAAGGGGVSSCITSTTDPNLNVHCTAGYAKPAWQIGSNVPADGVRDLPDLSLFAADGANGASWPVCAASGSCVPDSSNQVEISAVGGTSASAPAMAGIFALINQKYGRQGQANFILYPLAKQYPSVFNPITEGSNNVVCDSFVSTCTLDSNGDGYYSLHNYSAGAGYNLATGLGSVDVGAMLKYWTKVTFNPSSTALSLSSTSITHGDSVAISASVTSSSSGTPTGNVALVSDTTLPNYQGITALALDGTGKATDNVNYLPGGTYHLTAEYSGDGIFAPSQSEAATITVAPEASVAPLNLQFLKYGYLDAAIQNGDSIPLGSAIYADVIPTGKSGSQGIATGSVSYVDGSTPLGTVALSGSGTAEYVTSTLGIGPHTISASYSGDASYKPSQSSSVSFTVVKSDTFSFFEYPGYFNGSYSLGQDIAVVSATDPSSFGPVSPTGTMTIALSNGTATTCPLSPWYKWAISTCDLGSALPLGKYSYTATYSGDANYNSSTYTQSFSIVGAALLNTTTTFAITSPTDPSKIATSTGVTLTATVQGPPGATAAPTGTVRIWDAFFLSATPIALVPGTGPVATAALTLTPAQLANYSTNELTATYSGDSVYNSSVSAPVGLYNGAGEDYTFTLQSQALSVVAGKSASATINLGSVQSYNGTVSLACSVLGSASLTCSINPSSVTLNGNATAAISVNAYTSSATSSVAGQSSEWIFKGGATALALCFFVFPRRNRKYLASVVCLVFVLAVGAFASGCGGSSTKKPTTPTTTITNAAAGTYSIFVSGTGYNGVKHNAVLTINVQ